MKKVFLSFSTINGKGLFANSDIDMDSCILSSEGYVLTGEESSHFAIQIDSSRYLELEGKDAMYVNHSCDPNCYVDFSRINQGKILFRALQKIYAGEEITFNYNSTEYDMQYWNCSFNCNCGFSNCMKEIKGFKYIGDYHKEMMQFFLSPYLLQEYSNEKSNKEINEEVAVFG